MNFWNHAIDSHFVAVLALDQPARAPYYGPTVWTNEAEKSGGITIGARDILIAYNVNVDETDAVVAKKIGSIIRGSGRLIKRQNGKRSHD